MDVITCDKLFVETCFTVISVEDFSFSQTPGKHAVGNLLCTVESESIVLEQIRFSNIAIKTESLCFPLFAGIIKQLEVEYQGKYARVFIEFVSGTYLLDMEQRYRSFQKRHTYRDLLHHILEKSGKSICIIEEKDIEDTFTFCY